jgi:hypothetical protein
MSPPVTDTLSPIQPPSQVSVPDHIVKAVKESKCILFLGAMASAASPPGSPFQYNQGPPGGGELSRRLAQRCGYPDDDKWNLARVSLYFQTREDKSRHDLIKAITEEVSAQLLVPSPALQMLAALPFPIIVTTNYDHLFEIALRRTIVANGVTKDPIIHIYSPEAKAEDVPLDPAPERPILLKLHGDIDKAESIVVTEEDYITFIQRMSGQHFHPVPENIRARMKSWRILFVGYSLRDYNLRLLLRTLRWTVDPANFPLSFSVDPRPDNLIVAVWQRGEKKIVNFIQQDLWDFVPALFKECTGVDFKPQE